MASLVGMGGVGETSFGTRPILHGRPPPVVRSTWSRGLRKQLLWDRLRVQHPTFNYRSWFLKVWTLSPVFIVIDDVHNLGQFEELVPFTSSLHPGNCIVVTSRDWSTLNRVAARAQMAHQVFDVLTLGSEQSGLLFNWHAFQSEESLEDYKGSAKHVVGACDGLPLVLKVIGSSLCNKRLEGDRNTIWPEAISTLRQSRDVMDVLRWSYDSLEENEWSMFLDMAFLHTRDVMHLDLKPFNVLVQEHPGHIDVKITGLGLSRAFTKSETHAAYIGVGTGFWRALEIQLTETVDRSRAENMRMPGGPLNSHEAGICFGTEGKFRLFHLAPDAQKIFAGGDGEIEPERKTPRTRNWSAEETRTMLGLTEEALSVDDVPIWDYVSENLWERFGFDRAPISCENVWSALLHSSKATQDDESKTWTALDLECREIFERILASKSFEEKTRSIKTDAGFPSGLPFCQFHSSGSEVEVLHDVWWSTGRLEDNMGLFSVGDEVLCDDLMEDTCSSEYQGLSGETIGTVESHADVTTDSHVSHINEACYETNADGEYDELALGVKRSDLLIEDFEMELELKGFNSSDFNAGSGSWGEVEELIMGGGRGAHLSGLQELREFSGGLNKMGELKLNEWGTKSLPRSLGELSNVKVLDLSRCSNLVLLPDSFGDLSNLEVLDLSEWSNLTMLPESFGNLRNLEVLDLSRCSNLTMLPDSFGELSNLKVLDCSGCSNLTFLPKSFGDLRNLEVLKLSGWSNLTVQLQSFGFGNLSNLKEFDLNGCRNLTMLPKSFGNLSNLEVLNLSGCSKLTMLPDSFGELSNLKVLKLSGQGKLTMQLQSFGFGDLSNLKVLDLNGCSNLSMLPKSFGNLSNLEVLNLSGCSKLTMLPDSFGKLSNLKVLDCSGCSNLTLLPKSFGDLKNLEVLKLSGCNNLSMLPQSFGDLRKLEVLDLRRCSILTMLPDSFGELSNLKVLDCSGCSNLTFLPKSFGDLRNLEVLKLSGWSNLTVQLQSFGFGNLSNLKEFDLNGCRNLTMLPKSFGNLSNLEVLNLSGCSKLTMLPDSFGKLSNLKVLKLSGQGKLTMQLQSFGFGDLSNLKVLDLNGCSNLSMLPKSFGNLSNLEVLNLSGCSKLTMLPDSFGKLSNLKVLDCSGCSNLTLLPKSFGDLKNLEVLKLSGCNNLSMLPQSFGDLRKLEVLDLSRCSILTMLPDSFGELSNLKVLDCSGCSNLTFLPKSFGDLRNLEVLKLSGWSNLTVQLQSFGFGNLSNLKEFDLNGCRNLSMLPKSFGNLSNLEVLNLSGCNKLTMLPDSFGELSNLKVLDCSGCSNLTLLPKSVGDLRNLEVLKLSGWSNLTVQLTSFGFGNLSNLKEFDLNGCSNLSMLLKSFGNLSNLEVLDLSECSNVTMLPNSFGELRKLEALKLSGRSNLRMLLQSFGFGNLSNLKELDLNGCNNLTMLPKSFGNLSNLEVLNLSGCSNLTMLPQSFGELSNFKVLDLGGCRNLTILQQSFRELSNLQVLDLNGRSNLTMLSKSNGGRGARFSGVQGLRELGLKDLKEERELETASSTRCRQHLHLSSASEFVGMEMPSLVGAKNLFHWELDLLKLPTRNWSAEETRTMLGLTEEALSVDDVPIWDYVSENLWERFGFDRAPISCENVWSALLHSSKATQDDESKTWTALDLECREIFERILASKSFEEKTRSIKTDAGFPSGLPFCQFHSSGSEVEVLHDVWWSTGRLEDNMGLFSVGDEVLCDDLMEDTCSSEYQGLSGETIGTVESHADVTTDSYVSHITEACYETNASYAGRKRSAATVMEDELITRMAPFVNKEIEDAFKPLISVLRGRKEELQKYRQKLLVLEEEKLALKRQKTVCEELGTTF